jgi:hypothetical protein
VFLLAAEGFRELARQIRPAQWAAPGLGEWTVLDLVGHTSRALTTVEDYLRRGGRTIDVPDAASYFRQGRAVRARRPEFDAEIAEHLAADEGGRGLQLVAMPIVSDGAVSHVIAATAHPGRQLSEADQACAAALAAHLASCLEMVAAVSAAREYMLLEQAIAPGQTARGDRALEQMQLVRSLAGAFIGVRSLPEVGRIVVGQLHTLIDYHSCRFYVVSQDGDLLLPAALMGVGEVYAGEDVEDLVVAVGEGITGRVFETRKPLNRPPPRPPPRVSSTCSSAALARTQSRWTTTTINDRAVGSNRSPRLLLTSEA